VYAHAARAGLGTPETGVSAEYWFLRKDRGKRVALTLTPEVNEAYGAALAVIADGIAGGLFPHRPPDGDGWGGYVECSYCDTDGLGVKRCVTGGNASVATGGWTGTLRSSTRPRPWGRRDAGAA
jgi:hypothetical protein